MNKANYGDKTTLRKGEKRINKIPHRQTYF